MRPVLLIAVPASLVLGTLLSPIAATRGQEAEAEDASKSAAVTADPTVDDLLAAHNKARAEEKLPPLKAQCPAHRGRARHARDMAEHNNSVTKAATAPTPEDADQAHGLPLPGDRRERRRRPGVRRRGDADLDGEPAASREHPRRFHRDGWRRGEGLGRPELLVRRLRPAHAAGGSGQEPRRDDRRPEPGPHRGPEEEVEGGSPAGRVAEQFARLAAERKSMEIKDRDGQTPFDVLESQGFRPRRFAMTLASGEGDPAKVVESWLKDPRDRAALLSGFDRAGVGVATDSDGVPYWVILLAQGVAP